MNEKFGHWGNNYPANLDINATFLGFSRRDRQALATLETCKYILVVDQFIVLHNYS